MYLSIDILLFLRFHSLHHIRFRTNYSLFVPLYDYVYGTVDIDTESCREKSLDRKEESPDIIYLTHLVEPESIYQIRLGFSSLASKPQTSFAWYLRMLLPVTIFSRLITWYYGKAFVVERNVFRNRTIQSWVVPKHRIQVCVHLFIYLLICNCECNSSLCV